MQSGAAAGSVEVRVEPELVLKGQPPVAAITAVLPPSPIMSQHTERGLAHPAGVHGLWFIRQAPEGGYEILPWGQGEYTEMESFIRLPAAWIPPAGSSLSQKLLHAVLRSYQSAATPSRMDDGLLLVSLDAADLADALSVAHELMNSSAPGHLAMGLAAAIRRSSDDALIRTAQELNIVRLDERFSRITLSLENHYKPTSSASIAALRQLIELRSGAPGLDAALVGALRRVGTKEVLPVMTMLLDSSDPLAKRRACLYFDHFSALAGPDGEINLSGNGRHPFWTPDKPFSRATDWRDNPASLDEEAAFWKSWWMQNQEKLGFAPAAASP